MRPLKVLEYYRARESVWFSPTVEDDQEIVGLFAPWIDSAYSYEYQGESSSYVLGIVILLDQVTRHVRRVSPSLLSLTIDEYTWKAARLSEVLTGACYTEPADPFHALFTLLPLRHTRFVPMIERSIEVMKHVQTQAPGGSLCRRFLRAAYRDLLVANNKVCTHLVSPCDLSWTNTLSLTDVIERGSLLFPFPGYIQVPREWSRAFRKRVPVRDPVVSLSGGVDSVCILVSLLVSGFHPRAFHVNYGNRAESDLEEKFVTYLCHFLHVPCFVRKFHEVRRNDIERTCYEQATKEARFDCYSMIAGYSGCVLLGHHKDDVLENIVSNLSQGKKMDDLHGMTMDSTMMGVRIIRPFLDFPKQDILDFAHRYDIPYLKDSTLGTCQRGRLRNTMQCFETIPGFLPGLFVLANHVRDLSRIAEDLCETIVSPGVSSFPVNIELPQSVAPILWRTLLLRIGIYHVSNKSLENLVFKIGRELQKPYGTHSLNRDYFVRWNRKREFQIFKR